MTQTQSTQGRRPRWTKQEDDFLASARKSGLSKKEIVAQYKTNFPGIDRPDAGILARIPSFARANGREDDEDDVGLSPPPKEDRKQNIGDVAAEIYSLLLTHPTAERNRILAAVTVLCGPDVTATVTATPSPPGYGG